MGLVQEVLEIVKRRNPNEPAFLPPLDAQRAEETQTPSDNDATKILDQLGYPRAHLRPLQATMHNVRDERLLRQTRPQLSMFRRSSHCVPADLRRA